MGLTFEVGSPAFGELMAVQPDWARGYSEQAKEDFEAVRELVDDSGKCKADASVICMLLQMVFEKISKAA